MKISIKKRNLIKAYLINALKYYYKTPYPLIADRLLLKISAVIENTDPRSLPELNLYWAVMGWLENNTPEWVSAVMGVKCVNKNCWHEFVKSKFDISSIAFAKMDEQEFNEFLTKAIEWLEWFVLRCDKGELLKMAQSATKLKGGEML